MDLRLPFDDAAPEGGRRTPTPQPNPIAVEHRRRKGLCASMLAYMLARKGQWIPAAELWQPHVGGNKATSQRKRELIADGWVIEKRHVEGASYEYRLVGIKGQ